MSASTIQAAGYTWVRVPRGCWHQDSEGGRCLSLQGVIEEHTGWIWAQAREDTAEEVGLLRSAVAKVRADCKTMAAEQPPAETDHQIWLTGVRAQATRVLNILTALGVPESSEGTP